MLPKQQLLLTNVFSSAPQISATMFNEKQNTRRAQTSAKWRILPHTLTSTCTIIDSSRRKTRLHNIVGCFGLSSRPRWSSKVQNHSGIRQLPQFLLCPWNEGVCLGIILSLLWLPVLFWTLHPPVLSDNLALHWCFPSVWLSDPNCFHCLFPLFPIAL